MHLGLATLAAFLRDHRRQDSLVLATVIAIQGSSYRKPGAMMLIGADGDYAGMISGGCLEADLLLHAGEVLAEGRPRFVSYDNQTDEQLAWNLGLGCEGVIHLLLQRLDRQRGFDFLPRLFEALERRVGCQLALATGPDAPDLPPGSFALIDRGGRRLGEERLIACLKAHAASWPARSRHREVSIAVGDRPVPVLLVDIPPVPRILICGAGPDALPLTRMIAGLGWECFLVDHRPAHARAEKFPAATAVLQLRPETLAQRVALAEVGAAVVMTHNLEHDVAYLGQILNAAVPYVGLLGPTKRRRQIQRRLGCGPGRIHGPVGLDIGAELPESIALATVAEIHAALNGRAGGMLSALAPEATGEVKAVGCRDDAN